MKPDLIILHGALGCKTQFIEWADAFSASFTCHRLDFSGHGARSADDLEFSIPVFAGDLREYVNEKALRKPGVLGYSMGGYVALFAALQDPNLLGPIMTVATKFDWTAETAKKEAGYLRPQLMWQKVPQLVEQLRQRHGMHWETVVERTARMMLDLGDNPLLTPQQIARINNKIKFCVGDKDKMVSIHETYAIYKAAGNASLCVLPETGHLPEMMKLSKVHFEVSEFFSRAARQE